METKQPQKKNLFGRTEAQLAELAVELGEKKFRGRQLYLWLYKNQAGSIDEMHNLPAAFAGRLKEVAEIRRPEIVEKQEAADGTVKYIFQDGRGREFEAVWLPFENRVSLCISSQTGCSLDCTFCATGTLPFTGNLDVGQIVGQVTGMTADMSSRAQNIVFMGMGEPMYNYDNVIAAAGILSDPDTIGFSKHKITISTAGVLPRIKRYIEEGQPYGLAISLNHSNDEGRSRVMPINDKYNMADLKKAAQEYVQKTGKRITFEYVMMDGENISTEDATRLIKYVGGLKAKINLIPLNTALAGLKRPNQDTIDRFIEKLEPLKKRGVPLLNRRSPAREISGACGMLALERRHQA